MTVIEPDVEEMAVWLETLAASTHKPTPLEAAARLRSLLSSLSEAEARAERAEGRIDALNGEWAAADEALIQAGYETTELAEDLWMVPGLMPLYTRINQMNVDAEAERSRSSRVIEAAQKVNADMEEFPYEESGFGAEDFARLTANQAALAAALQDTPAEPMKTLLSGSGDVIVPGDDDDALHDDLKP